MARRFITMVICDLCNQEMPEDEATAITFSWQGKAYLLDVGPEELDSLTMNTIGGLLTVAAEAPTAFDGDAYTESTAPAPPTTRSAPSVPTPKPTEVTGRGGNVVKGAGRRRYDFDDYYKLWGTRENDVRQLRCPFCTYVTKVEGSGAERDNRRISQLRSHLARSYDRQMWAMAAELRGDAYDPDTEDKRRNR